MTDRASNRKQFGWFYEPQLVEPNKRWATLGMDKTYLLECIETSLNYAGEEIDGDLWIYVSANLIAKRTGLWSRQKVTRMLDDLIALGYLHEADYGIRSSVDERITHPNQMGRWITRGGAEI